MDKQALLESLTGSKQGLFATLDTTEEAFEYAVKVTGETPEAITALMVYHNTLIQAIIEVIKEMTDGV